MKVKKCFWEQKKTDKKVGLSKLFEFGLRFNVRLQQLYHK